MAEPAAPPWAQAAGPGTKRYRSPEGTFEPVLKSALEDTGLTDAERSVLFFIATKPEFNGDGEPWVLSVAALARDMGRPEERIRRALRGLRRAGYVTAKQDRARGRFGRGVSVLNRAKVLKTGDRPRDVEADSLDGDRGVNANRRQETPWGDRRVILTPRHESPGQHRKVNNRLTANYPSRDDCVNSDNGSVLLPEEPREADRALADARARLPSSFEAGREGPPSAVQDQGQDHGPAEDEGDEGARGRCAGCGRTGPHKAVLVHVLQPCPDWVALYRRDPAAALDPGTEYERWQRMLDGPDGGMTGHGHEQRGGQPA